jgi:hypothetical protein
MNHFKTLSCNQPLLFLCKFFAFSVMLIAIQLGCGRGKSDEKTRIAPGRNLIKEVAFTKIEELEVDEDNTITLNFEAPQGVPGLACTSEYFFYQSSDVTIIDQADTIVFSGEWPHCSATLKPLPNATGATIIRFSFSADGTTIATEFKITVKPVNDAPNLAPIATRSTFVNAATNAIDVVITDVDGPTGVLFCPGTGDTNFVRIKDRFPRSLQHG